MLASLFAGLFGFSIELYPRNSATKRSRNITGSDAVKKKEEEAYFYLRKTWLWDGGAKLPIGGESRPDRMGSRRTFFVEVKTRTSHDVKPAETAVDREKRRELAGTARDYRPRVREEV